MDFDVVTKKGKTNIYNTFFLNQMIGCIDNGPKMANFKIELWYIP